MMSFLAQICIMILIMLFLIWVYIVPPPKSDHERVFKVSEMIKWLYKTVNDVCYKCNVSPIYTIQETLDITHTDKSTTNSVKGTIYLLIWDEKYGRTFNKNTLIYSALHEIAHILSPSTNHNPPFDAIESMLLNKAIELSYYDPNIPIELNYKTLDSR